MLREAQASSGCVALPGGRAARILLVVLSVAALASCASGGLDLSSQAVDDTIKTASIPPIAARAADGARLSDEATIHNAVTSADIDAFESKGLSWANADTGSRGAITGLTERKRGKGVCRRFNASRESFDGVALFQGETCLGGAGWQVLSFDEI
ncbi:MAG: RT0821/Lpp0805 family surface protein [Rhizobiaceae bacterium]